MSSTRKNSVCPLLLSGIPTLMIPKRTLTQRSLHPDEGSLSSVSPARQQTSRNPRTAAQIQSSRALPSRMSAPRIVILPNDTTQSKPASRRSMRRRDGRISEELGSVMQQLNKHESRGSLGKRIRDPRLKALLTFTEAREAYLPTLDKAQMLFAAKNYRQSVEKMRELVGITAKRTDLEALGAAFLICGLIEVYIKEYTAACEHLIEVRNVADIMQDLGLKQAAYHHLGLCFRGLEMQDVSLKCFKKQLDLAWEINDVVSELACYDLIGMQYFYMNSLDKASYYHERMMSGKKEPERSDIRNRRHRIFHREIALRKKEGYTSECAKDVYLNSIVKKYHQTDRAAKKAGPRYCVSATSSPSARSLAKTLDLRPTCKKTPSELLHFAEGPAELSLDDLPSPHSHLDFGLNTYSCRAAAEEEAQSALSFKSALKTCPILVAYLHKRQEKKRVIVNLGRPQTQGVPITRKEAAKLRRAEEQSTRPVNHQIIVSHRSGSRGARRSQNDIMADTILKSFLYFPEYTKLAALRKFFKTY